MPPKQSMPAAFSDGGAAGKTFSGFMGGGLMGTKKLARRMVKHTKHKLCVKHIKEALGSGDQGLLTAGARRAWEFVFRVENHPYIDAEVMPMLIALIERGGTNKEPCHGSCLSATEHHFKCPHFELERDDADAGESESENEPFSDVDAALCCVSAVACMWQLDWTSRPTLIAGGLEDALLGLVQRHRSSPDADLRAQVCCSDGVTLARSLTHAHARTHARTNPQR
jgi:hypothetical protein